MSAGKQTTPTDAVVTRESLLDERKIPIYIGTFGHRNIRLESGDEEALRATVREAFHSLKKPFPNTDFILLTSIARGADQLVTEVAIEMGLPYIVVLPFKKELYLGRVVDGVPDFTDSERKNAERLIAGAMATYTLPYEPNANDFSIDATRSTVNAKTAVRLINKQFAETARFISDHSSAIIALWNGEYNAAVDTECGTALNVHDALHGICYSRNRTTGITVPETRPVYHIFTPAPGAARKPYDYRLRKLYPEPLLETGSSWFTLKAFDSALRSAGKSMTDAEAEIAVARLFGVKSRGIINSGADKIVRRILSREQRLITEREKIIRSQLDQINTYNLMLKKKKAVLDSGKVWGLELDAKGDDKVIGWYEKYFITSDKLAQHFQKIRKNAGSIMIYIAGASYICLNIFSDLFDNPMFLLLYVALMLAAFFIYRGLDRSGAHRRYVDYRTLAEGLRVQASWYNAWVIDKNLYPEEFTEDESGRLHVRNSNIYHTVAAVQNYYLRKQKSSIDWVRSAIRNCNFLLDVDHNFNSRLSRYSIENEPKVVRTCDKWLGLMDEFVDGKWVSHTDGQSGYFMGKNRKVKRYSRIFGWTAKSLAIFSFVLAAALLVCSLVGIEFASRAGVDGFTWLMFLAGAMPVLAMVFSEIDRFMGYGSDVGRTAWYHMAYKRAIVEIDEIKNTIKDSEKRHYMIIDLLFDIGKEALQENADWAMINDERAPELPSN